MKETGGTETSVKWPSWCYSDKVNCNVIRERSRVEKDFENNLSRSSKYKCALTKIQSARDCNTVHRCLTPPAKLLAPKRRVRPVIKILGEKKMLRESSLLLSEYINNNTTHSAKTNCDISNTKALAAVQLPGQGIDPSIANSTTAAAAVAYLYLEKVKNERMSPRVAAAQFDSLKDAIMESSSAAAAVAAAIVNNNNNNSNSNNNNHNTSNNNNNISGSGGNCSNSCSNKCNNLVNNQVQNQNANNSINITSDELLSHSLTLSCNQSQQQQHQLNKQSHNFHHQQQQQQLSFHMNSNHVKKERLSPGTNGDHPTPLSRSRSTTPSSFRGTSPQNSVHSSPSEITVPMHNLSANLLNSIHNAAASTRHGNLRPASPGTASASTGVPTDFSTRNYSDFMRSLAAKYNNANPNDNTKRNTLFDTPSNATTAQKKSSTPLQKASYATSPPSPHSREVTITTTPSLTSPAPMTSSVSISPSESTIKLSQQNKLAAAVANAAAACSSNNISPYMTSFLNSLQFSPGIFPPLIDMSSTQALITLARAAKEHEIQHILSASPQNMKRSATNAQPTPSPSLSMALQQAAQFISPALIYSAQLQKDQVQLQLQQQHQQQLQPQVARQSSPCLANISSSAAPSKSSRNHGKKLNVSPLDLSSQPTAIKRFKPESSSSQSSTDALLQTAIIRRSSSSTATTSPSPPPPLNEKSLNSSAIAVPTHAVTPSVVLGSSSQAEVTLTTFKPIKISSSTSTKSSIAPAVTVRQCQGQSEELNSWTVDDVCAFVSSIDICSEYAKHFRDQCIDGSGLPLLTEDHLVNSLGMKLGPALKLRSVLAKKLGGPCPCVTCVAQVQQMLALQTSGMTSTSTAITSEHTPANDTTNATASNGSIKSSSNCNIVLPKNLLSSNSSISCNSNNSSNNSPVNNNEAATTCSAISVNICNTDETANNITRSNNNSNSNVGNFSAPQQQTPAATTAQQYHFNQQQQKSPPPSTNCHDNTESSS